jgi:hypothetical protein
VKVEDGHLRVSDDAVVVYAVADCPLCRQKAAQTGIPNPNPPGDTFDISVRNMRIWVDVAHALYVGHFGDNARRAARGMRQSGWFKTSLDRLQPHQKRRAPSSTAP